MLTYDGIIANPLQIYCGSYKWSTLGDSIQHRYYWKEGRGFYKLTIIENLYN